MSADFKFSFISSSEFGSIIQENRNKIFTESNDINYMSLISDEEFEKYKKLNQITKDNIRKNLVCYYQDKLVGWSWGLQKDGEEFYMVNSAVFPEFRNRGVYTKMLSLMVEEVKQDGFLVISSNHHASNNSILIPKLKFGFNITGMKINPRFGVLIELQFHTNKKLNQVYEYRVGSIKNYN
jgi:hypothetical protein